MCNLFSMCDEPCIHLGIYTFSVVYVSDMEIVFVWRERENHRRYHYRTMTISTSSTVHDASVLIKLNELEKVGFTYNSYHFRDILTGEKLFNDESTNTFAVHVVLSLSSLRLYCSIPTSYPHSWMICNIFVASCRWRYPHFLSWWIYG